MSGNLTGLSMKPDTKHADDGSSETHLYVKRDGSPVRIKRTRRPPPIRRLIIKTAWLQSRVALDGEFTRQGVCATSHPIRGHGDHNLVSLRRSGRIGLSKSRVAFGDKNYQN